MFILVIMILTTSFAYADDRINIETPVVRTDIGELIIEKYITFPEYYFDSSVPFYPIEKKHHNNSTPEKAIVSLSSAINALDVGWFLTCWETESKNELIEKFKIKETKEFYLNGWKEQLFFDKLFLKRIIDRKNHIIVEYELQKDGKEKVKGIMDFVKINNGWFASRKHSGDLVDMYYTTGRKSIRLPEKDFDNYYLKKAKDKLTSQ